MAAIITSVTPGRGRDGDTGVDINGTGFSGTPGQNTVTVDGQAATVTGDTTTKVTFTVPSGIALNRHVLAQITNDDDATTDSRFWWSEDTVANLETKQVPGQIPGPFEDLASEAADLAEAKDYEEAVAAFEALRDDILPRTGTGAFPITDAGASKIGTLASAYQNVTPASDDVEAALEALDTATKGYVLPFGAVNDTASLFARPNGADGQVDGSDGAGFRHNVTQAGTVTAFAFNTALADATTDMKIHINGVAGPVIDLTGAEGVITGLSQAVVLGDFCSVEFDAGTAPFNSIYGVYVT